MNIGITLAHSQSGKIWNNGIAQNAINLYFLLRNIPQYNTYIVDSNYSDISEKNIGNYEDLKIYKLDDYLNCLNVIFIIGVEILDEQYNTLKENGCKIIHYNCGASYIVDMETVLFKEKDNPSKIYRHIPDEMWSIPQNYETNKYYFEALYKKECKEIPFIWSPFFLDKEIDLIKNTSGVDCFYKPNDKPKRITSFEPNINIVKYSLYNIIITEMLYKENKDIIEHLYITNTQQLKDNNLFLDTMNYFEINKSGKVSFESRYSTPHFLGSYTDIVISHQMLNPLNYAYLDALYLNYPLVHNASMIKDAGYYYNDFDAEQGKEQLKYAILEHDNNLDIYKEKSKKILDRYLPTNQENIEKYIKLIEDLFK